MWTDLLSELTQLLRTERSGLISIAAREGLRAEEALECVQDALCTWLVRGQREPDRDPATSLASLKLIVKNAARNGRRRHHRLKPHDPFDADRELAADARNAEQLLDAAETSLRLSVCVRELRAVERAVVTLRLLEERSGEDVAASLGLSRAHVDVLVHRAKATLRACMHAPDCA
ncbi:MAG TPA: sigma-70 family RNA polymerase sigma factor [Polyangiales bacterium]|jgi:RNA polymerase sigma-70 factor (ECF subfamily)